MRAPPKLARAESERAVPPEGEPPRKGWSILDLDDASRLGSYLLGMAHMCCLQLAQAQSDPLAAWVGSRLPELQRVWSALLASTRDVPFGDQVFSIRLGAPAELGEPPMDRAPLAVNQALHAAAADQNAAVSVRRAWASQLRDLAPRVGLRALEGVPPEVLELLSAPQGKPRYELRYVTFDSMENRIGEARVATRVALGDSVTDEQAITHAEHYVGELGRYTGWDNEEYPRDFELVRVLDWAPEDRPDRHAKAAP